MENIQESNCSLTLRKEFIPMICTGKMEGGLWFTYYIRIVIKINGDERPLILAICTSLMAGVHKHIQQAKELIFIDSSSFEDFNNPMLFYPHPRQLRVYPWELLLHRGRVQISMSNESSFNSVSSGDFLWTG